MKRKELEEVIWKITDEHASGGELPPYRNEDWILLNRRLNTKNIKRLRRVELITITGIIITAIAVVMALFKL
jgi:hypothetical protein